MKIHSLLTSPVVEFFLFLSLIASPVFAQSETLDALRTRLTVQNEVMSVSFRTLFVDSFTGDYSELSGTAWIAENQYKVETEDRFLWVKDSVSTLWDPAQNRVVISDYVPEEDDFAPARFFETDPSTVKISEVSSDNDASLPGESTLIDLGFTENELDRLGLTYIIPEIPRRSTWIELSSQDPYATLVDIVLVVDRDSEPLLIRAIDQVENVIHTQFRSVSWIREPASSLFEIQFPESAEVVDLRQKNAE
ncbi:MAG: hypothetical protein EBR93_04870 [Bacteroidetes bacterium]|nr:hypothetical protein [Bacteroidota bacterium]